MSYWYRRACSCRLCGRGFRAPGDSWICKQCREPFARAKDEAAALMRRAIMRGVLVPPQTLTCYDCGRPARGYDHRDYTKPLIVHPVCARCNRLRGPAAQLPKGWRSTRPRSAARDRRYDENLAALLQAATA